MTALAPRLLDVPAAAGYLSISEWTLRSLVADGHLSTVKLPSTDKGRRNEHGRRLLFDRADLDAFIEKSKVTTPVVAPLPKRNKKVQVIA